MSKQVIDILGFFCLFLEIIHRAFACGLSPVQLKNYGTVGGTVHSLFRGSYVSAHVLLNLLNELGKRDKMQGLPFYLFHNEFNKFNKTRARMLDFIYHMTLRLL